MADIEIGALTDRLSDDEFTDLKARLERTGAPKLEGGDEKDTVPIGDLDDDVLTEFLDRLDGNDAAAHAFHRAGTRTDRPASPK